MIRYFLNGQSINANGETEVELPELLVYPDLKLLEFFQTFYPDRNVRNKLYDAQRTLLGNFEDNGVFVTNNAMLLRLRLLHLASGAGKVHDWHKLDEVLENEFGDEPTERDYMEDGRGRAFTHRKYYDDGKLKTAIFVDPNSDGMRVYEDILAELPHPFARNVLPRRFFTSYDKKEGEDDEAQYYHAGTGENWAHDEEYGIEDIFLKHGHMMDVYDNTLNNFDSHAVQEITAPMIKDAVLRNELDILWPKLIESPMMFYDVWQQLEKAGDTFTLDRLKLYAAARENKPSKRNGGILNMIQYFKSGKQVNRKNTQRVQNNKRSTQNVLPIRNNRPKIDTPNPAPLDNTRYQPSTRVNYEKYRELQLLEGLKNYFENNPPNSITPFWHHDKKKKWYLDFFDWVPNFKNGKKIHIKESQKGTFTRYCNGKVTLECIDRAKASGNPRLVKKATFAENARKWKHLYGGVMNTSVDNEQPDFTNMYIDEESLNPYGDYTFGLQPQSKWYVGLKGSSDTKWEHDLNTVTTIYKELQAAIQKYYPQYSQTLADNLADYMTRHYVKENGWSIVHRAVGGYGNVKTVDEWVRRMKPTYPNAMKATNYNDYVEGLKANYLGNKYNSVNPNYYREMTRDFGPNTRVDKMLRLVRGIK